MERLTEKAPGCFEYRLKDHKSEPGEFGTYDVFFDYSMAVKRLGQYEDTCLEPEDVRRLQKDWTSLIMTIAEMGGIGHICDIIKAEQEGRLVVLPCKVGDTVYAIKRYGGKPIAIIEDKVQMVGVTSRSVRILLRAHHDHNQTFQLGKTVFLTREEAEKALDVEFGGADHEAD